MGEAEKAKAGRVEAWRRRRRAKRERSGDTPEAQREHAHDAKEYDESALKKLGARTGIFG